jgi:hypothetical protein
MSNMFIWIYSGGTGVKLMKHLGGGGGASYKILETTALYEVSNAATAQSTLIQNSFQYDHEKVENRLKDMSYYKPIMTAILTF